MDVAIGLPNAVPGTTGRSWPSGRAAPTPAVFQPGDDRPRRLRELRAADGTCRGGGGHRADRALHLGPARAASPNATELAKQALSLHALSGGRFTLGIGLGGREDDYEASGVEPRPRGKASMRCWSGSRRSGPAVRSVPRSRVAAGSGRRRSVDASFARAARFGDGWIAAGARPSSSPRWPARPRPPGRRRVATGSRGWASPTTRSATRRGGGTCLSRRLLRLARRGDRRLHRVSCRQGRETVKQYVAAFEAAGCDELILFPPPATPIRSTCWPTRWA